MTDEFAISQVARIPQETREHVASTVPQPIWCRPECRRATSCLADRNVVIGSSASGS
jgi:hypothetical protein